MSQSFVNKGIGTLSLYAKVVLPKTNQNKVCILFSALLNILYIPCIFLNK